MKKLMILVLATGLVFGFSGLALAGDNAASGAAAEGLGGLGSFFAPSYGAAGEAAVYKSSAVSATVRGADGCLPGDNFKLIVKSAIAKQKVKWVSTGTLKCDCTASSTLADSRDLFLANATKVKLKAIALPAGVPATAYVTMQGTGWIQKKLTDSCGF